MPQAEHEGVERQGHQGDVEQEEPVEGRPVEIKDVVGQSVIN
jgi:hypothetical protein